MSHTAFGSCTRENANRSSVGEHIPADMNTGIKERLIRILRARPDQLAAIDEILESNPGDGILNYATAKDFGVANAVAAVIETRAPLTRQEFEAYLNKQELARRLGKTVRTVDTWMAHGWIPFFKVGRTVAFRWSEVDAYLQTHFRVGARGRCAGRL